MLRPYRPDLFAFSPLAKIIVLPPSSWRQADVHRTSAFMIFKSGRLFLQKETHTFRCAFLFGGTGQI
jgi:hypothetical protein